MTEKSLTLDDLERCKLDDGQGNGDLRRSMGLTAKEALKVFLTLRYIITVRGSDDSIIFSIVAKFDTFGRKFSDKKKDFLDIFPTAQNL